MANRSIMEFKEKKHMLKSRENVTYARQSTIVIIDDEPAVTSALARLLRGNVNVLTANSGPEALAILRTISSIDLVLLDISMPKYNSVDLLGDMSTMKSAPPIILFTGHRLDFMETVADFASYLKLKVVARFEKPLRKEDLLSALKALK